MNEKQIINYAEFLNNNLEQLKINYKTSYNFIYKSSFFEYCNYIYVGLKNKCWLPDEYTNGIIK